MASGDSTNSNPYKGGPENYNKLEVYPVECYWGNKKFKYYFAKGSNKFNWYVIPLYITAPFNKIELYDANNKRI